MKRFKNTFKDYQSKLKESSITDSCLSWRLPKTSKSYGIFSVRLNKMNQNDHGLHTKQPYYLAMPWIP